MNTRNRRKTPRAARIVRHPTSLPGRPARRRIDAAMGRRERAVADLLEPAAVAIHWVGPDGTILWANRAELELLGYARGEYVGRHVAEFHADPDVGADILARLGGNETLRDYPARLRCKDGTIRHVLISSNVRWERGEFVHSRCFTRDATERRLAEEAVARLAAIVDSSEDAIIGKTLDGTVTSWNRAAERLYGYAAEEVVGGPIAVIVPPDRRDELAGIMDRLARGQRIAQQDTVRRRKDGSLLDVSVSISPVRDGAGAIIGAATIARDVTARRRAEERQRFLAEAAPVLAASLDYGATLAAVARLAVPRLGDWCAVHVVERDGALRPVAVVHADPAMEELARQATERYPPQPDAPSGLARVVRTGQAELVPDITDELLALVAQDAEHLRLLRAAGLRSYASVPLRARGRVVGALTLIAAESGRRFDEADLELAEALAAQAGLAVDNARLHDRARAAEAYYRGLLSGTADPVVVTDEGGRYVEVNPAAEALTGYSLDELRALQAAGGTVAAMGATWTAQEWARLRAEGRWVGELEVRRKDGTSVPIEASVTRIDLPAGGVYVAVWRDVTERRRLARLQEDFLLMVSHDLRTPLTALKGQAQLMRRRRAYSEAGVAAILGQAGRVERLVDDLADVARLEAGRPNLGPAPVDLVALAREGAAQARLLSERHPIRVEDPGHPVVGIWDRDRLGQVLQNLLINAIKYSPHGGEVVVRVGVADGDACLAVADRGVGIAPEAMPHLFDRFYRADAAGQPGGLGLGLYIGRMLVEAHGGRIWAESKPGRGSVFTVALPLTFEG